MALEVQSQELFDFHTFFEENHCLESRGQNIELWPLEPEPMVLTLPSPRPLPVQPGTDCSNFCVFLWFS